MKVVVWQFIGQSVIKREYTVDGKKDENSLFEAAKMFIQDQAKQKSFPVSCVIGCYHKSFLNKKCHRFNTYFVLKGAGMMEYAEVLRTKFLQQFGIDLVNEPIRDI
jgi:hypothetical protein